MLNDTLFDESQLVYGSVDNRIIYIRTSKGDVYRSGDEGKSFGLVTTPILMPKLNQSTGRIWRMSRGAYMPDGSNVMYFWTALIDRIPGYQQLCWVTTDGGLSFRLRSQFPKSIDTIIPHPKFPGVALLAQTTPNPVRWQLFKTFDAALTSQSIFKPFITVQRVIWTCTRSHPHRFVAAAVLGITNSNSPYWNNKVLQTDDYFDDYRLFLDHVNDWKLHFVMTPSTAAPPTAPAQQRSYESVAARQSADPAPIESYPQDWPVDDLDPHLHLFISRYKRPNDQPYVEYSQDPEVGWEFQPQNSRSVTFARSGYEDIVASSWHLYSVLNSSMHVLAWQPDHRHDIYKLETYPNSSALSFCVMQDHRPYTFVEFPNLPGTIMADRFYTDLATGQKTVAHFSYVSGNGGSTWKRLVAPDSTPSIARNLVLTGILDTSPLIYSLSNTIGSAFVTATSVLANSTLPLNYSHGNRLSVNTYFTNDGGYSWKSIGEGYHVPEFAAKGAMWITAIREKPTDNVTFSLDDGLTWRNIKITNTSVRIMNIRVASDYNSKVVLIHAMREGSDLNPAPDPPSPEVNIPQFSEPPSFSPNAPFESPSASSSPSDGSILPSTMTPSLSGYEVPSPSSSSSSSSYSDVPVSVAPPTAPPIAAPPPSDRPVLLQSLLIALDFSSGFPSCAKSDYEHWTPKDESGRERCTYGEKLVLKRRRSGHYCFPESEWPIVSARIPCECSIEDYECAPCFVRDEQTGRCSFVCGLEKNGDLRSRFGAVPLVDTISCASSTSHPPHYVWQGSSKLAYRKIAQTKCTEGRNVVTEFKDAIIPCNLAPTEQQTPQPPPKGHWTIPVQTLKGLGIAMLTFAVIGSFFAVVKFYYSICFQITRFLDWISPDQNRFLIENINWDDEEHQEPGHNEGIGDHNANGSDGDGDGDVELEDFGVPDTTTSSDEEDEARLLRG